MSGRCPAASVLLPSAGRWRDFETLDLHLQNSQISIYFRGAAVTYPNGSNFGKDLKDLKQIVLRVRCFWILKGPFFTEEITFRSSTIPL
jgi:hypothetical protein